MDSFLLIEQITKPGFMSLPAVMVVMMIVMIVWTNIAVVFLVSLPLRLLRMRGVIIPSTRAGTKGFFYYLIQFPSIQPDTPALGTIIDLYALPFGQVQGNLANGTVHG
jgi:hypothetical protein